MVSDSAWFREEDAMDSNAPITVLVALVGFLAALIGAMFGFIGVAVTAFFTSRNNNKNIFINTVTSERAKWRDELRNNTAEFCRLAHGHLHKNGTVDRLRLEELRVLIRLRLNPNPTHFLDRAILNATLKVTNTLDGAGSIDVTQQLEAVESNVQALLKQEWEKSKVEAHKGRLVIANAKNN
jgi:gluconate kinase